MTCIMFAFLQADDTATDDGVTILTVPEQQVRSVSARW